MTTEVAACGAARSHSSFRSILSRLLCLSTYSEYFSYSCDTIYTVDPTYSYHILLLATTVNLYLQPVGCERHRYNEPDDDDESDDGDGDEYDGYGNANDGYDAGGDAWNAGDGDVQCHAGEVWQGRTGAG